MIVDFKITELKTEVCRVALKLFSLATDLLGTGPDPSGSTPISETLGCQMFPVCLSVYGYREIPSSVNETSSLCWCFFQLSKWRCDVIVGLGPQFSGELSLAAAAAIRSCRMAIMLGGVEAEPAEPEPFGGTVGEVAWVLSVRFRFQQSGKIFFCSSAMSLALCEYCSRSSCGNDFHASPNKTLMAL